MRVVNEADVRFPVWLYQRVSVHCLVLGLMDSDKLAYAAC